MKVSWSFILNVAGVALPIVAGIAAGKESQKELQHMVRQEVKRQTATVKQ